jgi:cell division protein FtsQ
MRADTLPPPTSPPASPPVLRMLGWCLALSLIAAALLPMAPRLLAMHAPLTLEVSGEFGRVTPEAVRAVVAPRLNEDFFALDLAAIRRSVEAQPWVAQARVERAWPGTVRVQLWEHRPYARWGEQSLLSQDGTVFTPDDSTVLSGLPHLGGPDGRHLEVREVFEVLRGQHAGTPFEPVRLELSARGEWTAVTAAGIELRLGRNSPLDAMEMLSGPIQTALAGRLQEVAYVDFHYINGFAVGWRDGRAGDGIPGAKPAEERGG